MNNQNEYSRFSDTQLAEFHMEFKNHVEEYRERMKRYDDKFDQVVESQEENAKAIGELIRETRGIVELHRDLQGATRLGMSAQNFVVWLAKWGTIGVGLSMTIKWSFDHLQKFFN